MLALATVLMAAPAAGYVHLTVDFIDIKGKPIVAHWPRDAFPVPIRVSKGLSSDIPGSTELPALTSAIDTWNAVDGSAARLEFAGQGKVEAGLIDGINAIEFSDDPELEFESSLSLSFTLMEKNGTLLEYDLLINDRVFGFNIDAGNVGLDLETVFVRELGQFLGLDVSAVGTLDFESETQKIDENSAVMYAIPRRPTETAHDLRIDDMAAVAALYPSGRRHGSISGTVTLSGEPVFGAHVVVFEASSGDLVGALTLPDGTYTVGGLLPGRYVMRVQPLTDSINPSSLGGIYSTRAFDINSAFLPVFFDAAIDVEAGSETTGINVEVR